MKKYLCELLGTFWLVFGGCGSAIYAAGITNVGIGLLGVSFAFGLTVLTMAYTIGPISGCHLNPAVTIGLWMVERFKAKEVIPYIAAQCIGAVLAGGVLYFIATGSSDFKIIDSAGAFATNGYNKYSPGGYSMPAVLLAEFVLTYFFLLIIMAVTDDDAPAGFAPIAIGLGLTLIHLISIPISNTSVNPARSLGVAVFFKPALSQLWLFCFAPITGAVLGAITYRYLKNKDVAEE